MRYFQPLILLMILGMICFPAHGQEQRLTVDSKAYAQALLETESTESDIKDFEKNVDRHFENLGPVIDGTLVPLSAALRKVNSRWLDLIVQGYCSGANELFNPTFSSQMMDDIEKNKFFVFQNTREKFWLEIEVFRRARRASEDYKIANAHHQAQFPWKGWTFEKLFGHLMPIAEKYSPGVIGIKNPDSGNDFIVDSRPQQLMLAKAFFQYGTSYSGESILEIGYGTAPVLYALSLILPGRKYRGLDIKEVPAGANQRLKKSGVELWQGNAPKDKDILNQVAKDGPYSSIFALDTILETGFDPGVSPEEYLNFLSDNLIEGGTLIILNDFRRAPYFKLAQVRKSGFRTIVWDKPQDLGPKTIALYRQLKDQKPLVGQMSLFVLRKGDLTLKRIRLKAEPTK